MSPTKILLTATIFHLCTGVCWAQTASEHEAETIKVQPLVEHYRPERSPRIHEASRGIVQATNRFRQQHDRGELSISPELSAAARRFAQYMARTDRYGHEADGNRPRDRAEQQGYEYCIIAENIAYDFNSRGFSTDQLVETLVDGWRHSPPHRRNMLDSDVVETGVGVAQSDETGVFYAVQMFGRPRSKRIEFSITNESNDAINYVLADQHFTLPPRYSRTHERCRPGTLEFRSGDESRPTQAVGKRTFHPRNGEQFLVEAAGQGRFTVSED